MKKNKENIAGAYNLLRYWNGLIYLRVELLNTANMVLIPKKDGANSVADYRSVSLIHGIVKLISKILAQCLQPFMNTFVCRAQSAFIKKIKYQRQLHVYPQPGKVVPPNKYAHPTP